jgi:ribose 5-phosphate isomerase
LIVHVEGSLLICDQLLVKIKLLTGVAEVGIFCDVVKAAYFGNQVRTRRKDPLGRC